MADSGNIIGQFRDEIEPEVKEVAQDVKDFVGEAIEQGVQSVVGAQFTPQQQQQKQFQDQKELQRVRGWFKDLEQQTAQVRQMNKQNWLQKGAHWKEKWQQV